MPKKERLSEKQFTEVLDRIVSGESLTSICKDTHLPSWRTVLRHCQDTEEAYERYARARAAQSEVLMDQIADIWNEPFPEDAKEKHSEVLRRDKASYWLDKRARQMQPKGLTNKADTKQDTGVITLSWQNTADDESNGNNTAQVMKLVKPSE